MKTFECFVNVDKILKFRYNTPDDWTKMPNGEEIEQQLKEAVDEILAIRERLAKEHGWIITHCFGY